MSLESVPFDKRDGFIWYNGEMVPWGDAKVHVLNHGLHYASSVFEGVRVYDGKIFENTRHNTRLHASANILGFEIPYSVAELDEACNAIVERQGVKNGYLRPVAWRGSEQMAILTDKSSTHVAIATWEWPSYFSTEALEKGLNLTYAAWRRPDPATAPIDSKAAGLYMICTMSKNIAVQGGFDDALMLDWQGRVAEATGANVFFLMDGELHTPIADCFLNGITRQTVIELAKARGITVVERRIMPEDIVHAQEAFLTGSAAEVTPIGSIKGEYGDAEFVVGETTKGLMAAYSDLVRS